jgi:chitinase
LSADGDYGLALGVAGSSVAPHQGAATAIYAVDGTAPGAVTGLAASMGRRNVVSLSWPASFDAGSGISAYRVFRNGTLLTTTTGTTYQDRSATTSGTYDYTVVAVDGVGNTSVPGNVARITVGSSAPGGGKRK